MLKSRILFLIQFLTLGGFVFAQNKLKLEKVTVVSRHNVRAPLEKYLNTLDEMTGDGWNVYKSMLEGAGGDAVTVGAAVSLPQEGAQHSECGFSFACGERLISHSTSRKAQKFFSHGRKKETHLTRHPVLRHCAALHAERGPGADVSRAVILCRLYHGGSMEQNEG